MCRRFRNCGPASSIVFPLCKFWCPIELRDVWIVGLQSETHFLVYLMLFLQSFECCVKFRRKLLGLIVFGFSMSRHILYQYLCIFFLPCYVHNDRASSLLCWNNKCVPSVFQFLLCSVFWFGCFCHLYIVQQLERGIVGFEILF